MAEKIHCFMKKAMTVATLKVKFKSILVSHTTRWAVTKIAKSFLLRWAL